MDVEYTIGNLPDELVQLVLVYTPNIDFIKYSVVCKLWHKISNSRSFWKQCCIDALGSGIVATTWTPQLVEALESSTVGEENLLMPTKKENSLYVVDWRRYYYLMVRFSEAVNLRRDEEFYYVNLTPNICKKYLNEAAFGVEDPTIEFLLACDLLRLLLERGWESLAHLVLTSLKMSCKLLMAEANSHGLLVAVKLYQTIDSIWTLLPVGLLFAEKLLKLAVSAFRSMKVIGKTSRRLFSGLCHYLILVTDSSKHRKLNFHSEYKYRMIGKLSPLLKYTELDEDLYQAISHFYYYNDDSHVKTAAMAAYCVTSSCREKFGINMLKIALHVPDDEASSTMQKNAAVIICHICTYNKAAMLAVSDTMLLEIFKKLISYLRNDFYPLEPLLNAIGSLPVQRSYLIPNDYFRQMNRRILARALETNLVALEMDALAKLGLVFGKRFRENTNWLLIYREIMFLPDTEVSDSALVAYLTLGRNALEKEFNEEAKDIIKNAVDGKYRGVSPSSVVVKMQDQILKLFRDDKETVTKFIDAVFGSFQEDYEDQTVGYILTLFGTSVDRIAQTKEALKFPSSMEQHTEYLERQLIDTAALPNYFVEEKTDDKALAKTEAYYIKQPGASLNDDYSMGKAKHEASKNSKALLALIQFKDALGPGLFKQHTQRLLQMFFTEAYLLCSTHHNLSSIVLLLKELRPHLSDVDLQAYISLLITTVSESIRREDADPRSPLRGMYTYCIVESIELYKQVRVPHVGILSQLLKYFMRCSEVSVKSKRFPDLNGVMTYLESFCRLWPRLTYAAFVQFYSSFAKEHALDLEEDEMEILHFKRLTAVGLWYFGIDNMPGVFPLEERRAEYLEFYRGIPEIYTESRSIIQRMVYLLSAAIVDVNFTKISFFNFSSVTQEQALRTILDPRFDTGDTELNLNARRETISPMEDDSCMFEKCGRPALRLFYGFFRDAN